MDNRDTCCLKNRKRMEADTVWQWRIMHVKKYSRSPEPFYYSHKMGLDFNLSSTTQKKLHLQLLTNGVILEVCDFAKTVNKSKRHFITNILENNFDLRFENEQQRTNFTAQIQHELKDLIRKSPKDTHEVFTLFDTSSVPECSSNKASTEHQCDGFMEEMEEDDDDSELEDLFKSSQTPSVKTKEEMDGRHVDDKHETEFSETQLTEEDKEDVLPPSFPRCEEIGLNLDVGSKQSLDPRLLTNGVMLELEDITRILTASYSSIVLSVLEHNFELDLKSQRGRDEVWFMISQLLRRRKRLSTAGIKLTQEFKGEFFSCQTNPHKRSHGLGLSNIEESKQGDNLWKLRANRVKKILLVLDKQCRLLGKIRNFHLEFNVGFGPKQNISADYLTDSVLVKVARFALDMSSSQQEFIMEILENNFDFGLQSKYHKHRFACEIMDRVRQLRNCEDAVKFSREVFELPNSMSSIKMTHQRMGSVKPELDRLSRMRPCDVAATCALDSPAEAKPDLHAEVISNQSVEHYPFCKEIGLKLNVKNSREKVKLDVNKLTKGAMTEVTNFAEKLCGTFQQICIDILRHNFDLDLPSVDSDLARNILAYIPVVIEQRNLATCVDRVTWKPKRSHGSIVTKLLCHDKANLTACSSGSTQATVDQNVSKSTFTEQKNDSNSLMWNLRANHVQQMLSAPHGEDCPLYSYSRCKKLGIDFNVASGVKQNLDPKLLTNGIMVEIYTFATELLSDAKHFSTEILEYNFDLNLNSEMYRSAFADELGRQMIVTKKKRSFVSLKQELFELPDLRCLEEYNPHCLKCYQDRTSKLRQDVSDSGLMLPGHPHAMTDIVSVDANCTAQKPAKNSTSISQTSEEMLTSSYHHCKEIGLSLCVDKDHPKRKLATHVLTNAVISEVYSFAKKLCGTKIKIVADILDHNFNLDTQRQQKNPAELFNRLPPNAGEPAWFNEVFVIYHPSHRAPPVRSNWTEINDTQRSERKETFRKRQLEMQKKKEGDMLQRLNHPTALCTSQTAEGDFNYMCPVEADDITDSEISGNEDPCRTPTSSDIPRESLSGCVGVLEPLLTSINGSSSLPNINVDMNPPFASQPDKSRLPGHEEQTRIPTNVLNECDMEPEEMGTESDLWKLRAYRANQILAQDKQCYVIGNSRKVNVEFNVGFGPKQNLSADYLTDSVLLNIARFAVDMSSSQQEFIMEILENNFDLGLQSKYHKHRFACELMKRITQLKNCEDAVKFSREVFELPNSMSPIDMTHQRMGSVKPELGNILTKRQCDVAPTCTFVSHPEPKADSLAEAISKNRVDCYRFCKEIGLRLHVNTSQGNKKLDVNKLTKGAMTEVTNFAEEFCGTFEQICIDILRHNFDLDLPSVDSDLARNILAYIPAAIEQRNLVTCGIHAKAKPKRNYDSIMTKLLCQKKESIEANSTCSIQTTVDQNVSKSTSTEQNDDSNSLLWKLRANHIQQILSAPHREDCPLYSYSRCKKLGINFNVASGVKQNLDPKLLTNGIMVEMNTFATALLSAAKHFSTEILEYNFDLNLNSEMYRSAFADELKRQTKVMKNKRSSVSRKKAPFELPDWRCLEGYTPHCLKCYQDRSFKLCQDETNPGHMLHGNCTAQNPAKNSTSIFQTSEKMLTSCYRHCRKIGLSLCVDKDHPRDELDTYVLTNAVMSEVYLFTKKLCGTRHKIINDILEHNFNLDMQSLQINPSFLFTRMPPNAGEPAWFSEVFVIYQPSHRDPTVGSKSKEQNVIKRSERKETFRKRQLEMQTKKEIAVLQSVDSGAKRLKKNEGAREHLFPICNEIGLDLDVTSKSGDKEKLDLNLLTTSVVLEMHKFASYKTRHYLPNTLYEILDYNFDLSSQHPRCWEFAIATASKISAFVKTWRNHASSRVEKVFKLPFVINPISSERTTQQQNKNRGNSSSEEPHRQTNEQSWFEWTQSQPDHWTKMQMNDSPMRAGCDSLLHGNIQIKQEEYDPYYADMNLELDTEEEYHPYCDDVKTESISEDDNDLVHGEPAGSLWINKCLISKSGTEKESEMDDFQHSSLPAAQVSEGDDMQDEDTNTERLIKTESDTGDVKCFVPLELGGSLEYSMVTIGQDTENTLIKEEQENVPVESYHYGVISNTGSEMDIKQEDQPS